MDASPFLTLNILNFRNNQVPELKKFCKSEFDIDSIFTTASELKYMHEFKTVFSAQLENPSDEFLRLFLQGCYSGQKTQSVLEKFRPILKKALNDYISETMNEKIKAALGNNEESRSSGEKNFPVEPTEKIEEESDEPKIVTTEEELEAYFIVKNMLSDVVPLRDITYKDTATYINFLYKGNTRKWLCRLQLSPNKKFLFIPDENKNATKYIIDDIYQLTQYSDALHAVLKRYMD